MIRDCLQCGQPIEPDPYAGRGRPRDYCPTCRPPRPVDPAPLPERSCEWCGARFQPTTARQRFDSIACRYKWKDRARHVTRGTHRETGCVDCGATFAYESTTRPRKRCDACRTRKMGTRPPERLCAWCWKTFQPRNRAAKFCSTKCRVDEDNNRRPSRAKAPAEVNT